MFTCHIWDIFLLWQRYMNCCNWLLNALLHNCAFSIDSYSPINKFYSFVLFSVLINAVILLLNCLVLILYLYIHFLSLRCYFIYLYIFGALYNWHCSETILIFVLFHYFYISWCWNYFPRMWGTGISDAIFQLWPYRTLSICDLIWVQCIGMCHDKFNAQRKLCELYNVVFTVW